MSRLEVMSSGGTIKRRSVISGALATGAAIAGMPGVMAQSSPVASPAASPAAAIELDRVMAVSTELCGGAKLADAAGEGLVSILSSEPGAIAAFEELEGLPEFTSESVAGTSAEAQALSANILQYWFLGRWNGEPVQERSDIFFSLACWQALPYATQISSCKSYGYWQAEIEL